MPWNILWLSAMSKWNIIFSLYDCIELYLVRTKKCLYYTDIYYSRGYHCTFFPYQLIGLHAALSFYIPSICFKCWSTLTFVIVYDLLQLCMEDIKTHLFWFLSNNFTNSPVLTYELYILELGFCLLSNSYKLFWLLACSRTWATVLFT